MMSYSFFYYFSPFLSFSPAFHVSKMLSSLLQLLLNIADNMRVVHGPWQLSGSGVEQNISSSALAFSLPVSDAGYNCR